MQSLKVKQIDWSEVREKLNDFGFSSLGSFFSKDECDAFIAEYNLGERYRSRVEMARHNFGRGEYRYFCYPLPERILKLRCELFPYFSAIANEWMAKLALDKRYPDAHDDYLTQCAKSGQVKPTPLILKYQSGDYNCLHQDLYGVEVFPIQVAILLSKPGDDFNGGELVVTEQRPRMQSRASVVPMMQGEAIAFAVNERPAQGARSVYRVKMRHGVSTIRRGNRFALGIIFHDAQ